MFGGKGGGIGGIGGATPLHMTPASVSCEQPVLSETPHPEKEHWSSLGTASMAHSTSVIQTGPEPGP